MKTKEVLKHLGVTRQNLQYYIKMGKITPVGKEGTSYIFDERQIKSFKVSDWETGKAKKLMQRLSEKLILKHVRETIIEKEGVRQEEYIQVFEGALKLGNYKTLKEIEKVYCKKP